MTLVEGFKLVWFCLLAAFETLVLSVVRPSVHTTVEIDIFLHHFVSLVMYFLLLLVSRSRCANCVSRCSVVCCKEGSVDFVPLLGDWGCIAWFSDTLSGGSNLSSRQRQAQLLHWIGIGFGLYRRCFTVLFQGHVDWGWKTSTKIQEVQSQCAPKLPLWWSNTRTARNSATCKFCSYWMRFYIVLWNSNKNFKPLHVLVSWVWNTSLPTTSQTQP